MEPVTVEICTGTACFVMGGSELLLLTDELADRWADIHISHEEIEKSVRVMGKTCTGHCRLPEMRPPFVLIDGVLVGEATVDKIADAILPQVLKSLEQRSDGV